MMENNQKSHDIRTGRLGDLSVHRDSYVQGIVLAIAQADAEAEEIFSQRLREVIIEIEKAKIGIEI